jgi:photosystem II stability/assembly factor-like uncharacterized protein
MAKASGKFSPISPVLLMDDKTDTTSFISALAIAPSNPLWVYAATAENAVGTASALHVTKDRKSWTRITRLALPKGWFVLRIAVDAANPKRLVIVVQGPTFGGRVQLSDNAGNDWTDITRNLPGNLVVYAIAVDWRFPDPDVYVGTDRGVYTTKLKSGRWRPVGEGLPNTLVSDLEITPGGTLTAAAYGRGGFQLHLEPRR